MIGDLKLMPLEEILQWLGNGKRTGILKVSNSYITKKIYFKNGLIISASSSDPRDYLGQFLLSKGWISEIQLVKAIELQEMKKSLLGKILVDLKILSEEQIKEALREKTLETIFSLFLWEEGKFEFTNEEFQNFKYIPLEENVDRLILEGIRRKNDWIRVIKNFKSLNAVVAKVPEKKLPAKLSNNIIVKNLWDAIDGEKSLLEIALHLHCTDYEIGSSAQMLLDMQLIKIVKIKPAKEESYSLPIQMVVSLGQKKLKEGKVEEALNIFNYLANKYNNLDPRIIELRDLAEKRYIKQIKEGLLNPEKVPKLTVSAADAAVVNLTPEESFLLSRINGTWTIKEIFCVVPFNELTAIKFLKSLIDKGLVELK
jgi:hypothetical protein